MTTARKPEQSQIMAARVKVRIAEKLGTEVGSRTRELASMALPGDPPRADSHPAA
jgi:hypothetical protein